MAIDPRDGEILAMVGGRSFKKSQFNLATQSQRQAGSAFKPFVLAAALGEGLSPSSTLVSKPLYLSLGDRFWSVSNSEDSYLGRIDLKAATAYSDNTVFAQLTQIVGPKAVAAAAKALGIQSPLYPYLSIGLGTDPVNPLEMARAFATLANGGVRIDGSKLGDEPRAVLGYRDWKGNVRANAVVPAQQITSNDAAIITSLLENVISYGTGTRAALPDRVAAGKTGTTENYGDAWFVGYTPQLAVAVWVGYPNKLVPMEHLYHGRPVFGGTYPALIWKSFMELAFPYLERTDPGGSWEPQYFSNPSYPYSVSKQVVWRNNKLMLDNGNCRHSFPLDYFDTFGPHQPRQVQAQRGRGAERDRDEARQGRGAAGAAAAQRRGSLQARQAAAAARRRDRPGPAQGHALLLRQRHRRAGQAGERARARRRRAHAAAGPRQGEVARAQARGGRLRSGESGPGRRAAPPGRRRRQARHDRHARRGPRLR